MATDHQLREAIDAGHELLDRDLATEALGPMEAVLAGSGGDAALRAEAHGLAGVAARGAEDLARAASHFDAACAILAQLADPASRRLLASILEDRAELELESRAPDAARRCLRDAIRLREGLGETIDVETWLALAEAEQRALAIEAALDAIDRAIATAGTTDDHGAALAHEMRGDALLARGDDAALSLSDVSYAEAWRRWRALGDRCAVSRCLIGLARIAERRDDAVVLADVAREIRTLDGLPPGDLRDAIDELASLFESLDRSDLARALRSEAP